MLDSHGRLERGDIVFLAAPGSHQQLPDDLSRFPVLAGYVQTYPYREARPWFHVGIALGVNDGVERMVSFPEVDDRRPFAQQLESHPVSDIPSDLQITALRLPDQEKRELIARIAEQQVERCTVYSVPGLLGFAIAMVARMMPEAGWEQGGARTRGRTELLEIARGADLLARSLPGETCVTAVAKAVAPVARLALPAPPAPCRIPPDDGPNTLEAQLVDALRLRAGGQRQGQLLGPALVMKTEDYLELIRTALTNFFRPLLGAPTQLLDSLREIGRSSGRDPDPELGMLASPAMLYDGLLDQGFQIVS